MKALKNMGKGLMFLLFPMIIGSSLRAQTKTLYQKEALLKSTIEDVLSPAKINCKKLKITGCERETIKYPSHERISLELDFGCKTNYSGKLMASSEITGKDTTVDYVEIFVPLGEKRKEKFFLSYDPVYDDPTPEEAEQEEIMLRKGRLSNGISTDPYSWPVIFTTTDSLKKSQLNSLVKYFLVP